MMNSRRNGDNAFHHFDEAIVPDELLQDGEDMYHNDVPVDNPDL
jgi:hypothetical protein